MAFPFFCVMESLVLAKFILATPWLLYLAVKDYRTRQLPYSVTLGGSGGYGSGGIGI